MRFVSRIVALLFLVEAALTIAWLTSLLSTIRIYGGVTLTLMAARAVVAALQFSGWMLLSRAQGASAAPRPGIPIAGIAIIASALLTTVEVGWRLTPSNLDPTFRWPFIAGYWVYAAAVIGVLARVARAQ